MVEDLKLNIVSAINEMANNSLKRRNNAILGTLSFSNIVQRKKIRKAYYDDFLIKYGSLPLIFSRLDGFIVEENFYAEKTITFKSKLQFGTPKEGIMQRLGKPICTLQSPISKDHEVLYYKYRLGHRNIIKCEIHLYRKLFFMGIYISNSLSNDNSAIKKYFLERYIGTNKIPGNGESIRVTDKNQNSIYVIDAITLEMIYTINYKL